MKHNSRMKSYKISQLWSSYCWWAEVLPFFFFANYCIYANWKCLIKSILANFQEKKRKNIFFEDISHVNWIPWHEICISSHRISSVHICMLSAFAWFKKPKTKMIKTQTERYNLLIAPIKLLPNLSLNLYHRKACICLAHL